MELEDKFVVLSSLLDLVSLDLLYLGVSVEAHGDAEENLEEEKADHYQLIPIKGLAINIKRSILNINSYFGYGITATTCALIIR